MNVHMLIESAKPLADAGKLARFSLRQGTGDRKIHLAVIIPSQAETVSTGEMAPSRILIISDDPSKVEKVTGAMPGDIPLGAADQEIAVSAALTLLMDILQLDVQVGEAVPSTAEVVPASTTAEQVAGVMGATALEGGG